MAFSRRSFLVAAGGVLASGLAVGRAAARAIAANTASSAQGTPPPDPRFDVIGGPPMASGTVDGFTPDGFALATEFGPIDVLASRELTTSFGRLIGGSGLAPGDEVSAIGDWNETGKLVATELSPMFRTESGEVSSSSDDGLVVGGTPYVIGPIRDVLTRRGVQLPVPAGSPVTLLYALRGNGQRQVGVLTAEA